MAWEPLRSGSSRESRQASKFLAVKYREVAYHLTF